MLRSENSRQKAFDPSHLPQQGLLHELRDLDWKAYKACINFLQSQYPSLLEEQAEKLVLLIFEPNFKEHLPNHFGKLGSGKWFGFPFIWLLNELKLGGVKYLYQNQIWQVYWDVSSRYEGDIRQEKNIKYLLTNGPCGKEAEQLFKQYGLIFFSCSAFSSRQFFQYPFSEDLDLSCPLEYCSNLKLRDTPHDSIVGSAADPC